MKCLVTGGAGFIGSHLCRYLLAEGKEVLCLDNLSTGKLVNVEPLLKHTGFTFIEADVRSELAYPADRVYNLACPASPAHYSADPIATMETTIHGVFRCVEHALRYKSRILHASTSEVYGDPVEHPQSETYWGNVNPIGPRSCYTESKRMAETILTTYSGQHGISVRIARIFNTYGPHMRVDDGRVISNFITQALNCEELTIYGDGKQSRSFCFCADLVAGLAALMEYPKGIGPVNLGNSSEYPIDLLAKIILRITNSRSGIEFRPLPEDDPQRRKPDLHKAYTCLGWKPTVDLDTGLQKTVEYFKAL